MNKKAVTIIDAMCGAGKTSWAIQEINKNPEGPWLFITPYLDEVGRILEACSGFHQPSDKGQTKRDSLGELLAGNQNIVSTHALFEGLDEDAIELIRRQGYRLIIDEVPPVLGNIPFKKAKMKALFQTDILRKGKEIAEKVIKVESGDMEGFDEYDNLKATAKQDRLVLVDDALFFWLFPVRAFEAFKEITVMTYLYPGSITSCYFQCYDFEVDRKTVVGDTGDYQVVPYDISLEVERRAKIKALVTIYEMKKDRLYDGKGLLSATWYKKASKADTDRIKNDTTNFLRHKMEAKPDKVMWTTFKDHKTKVQPDGYTKDKKSFASCNLVASNGYRERNVLAYLVNWYFNPTYQKFFDGFEVTMNEDLYALGSFIQWFFRSAIRDGKPVTVWLPSSRMRGLFERWLDCQL